LSCWTLEPPHSSDRTAIYNVSVNLFVVLLLLRRRR